MVCGQKRRDCRVGGTGQRIVRDGGQRISKERCEPLYGYARSRLALTIEYTRQGKSQGLGVLVGVEEVQCNEQTAEDRPVRPGEFKVVEKKGGRLVCLDEHKSLRATSRRR